MKCDEIRTVYCPAFEHLNFDKSVNNLLEKGYEICETQIVTQLNDGKTMMYAMLSKCVEK